jgi:hypothetical protein
MHLNIFCPGYSKAMNKKRLKRLKVNFLGKISGCTPSPRLENNPDDAHRNDELV